MPSPIRHFPSWDIDAASPAMAIFVFGCGHMARMASMCPGQGWPIPAPDPDECVILRWPDRLGWLQMCENHSLMVTERRGNGWGAPPVTLREAQPLMRPLTTAGSGSRTTRVGTRRGLPSSVFWSWAASRHGTTRPRSTSPSTCPRGWRPSSITIWRTTPSIHPCSRCLAAFSRFWPSIRSSPPTGTGTSTTNAVQRSLRRGPD